MKEFISIAPYIIEKVRKKFADDGMKTRIMDALYAFEIERCKHCSGMVDKTARTCTQGDCGQGLVGLGGGERITRAWNDAEGCADDINLPYYEGKFSNYENVKIILDDDEVLEIIL